MSEYTQRPVGPLVKRFDLVGNLLGYFDSQGVQFSVGGPGGPFMIATASDILTASVPTDALAAAAAQAAADANTTGKLSTPSSMVASTRVVTTTTGTFVLTSSTAPPAGFNFVTCPAGGTMSAAVDGSPTVLQAGANFMWNGTTWTFVPRNPILGIFANTGLLPASSFDLAGSWALTGAGVPYVLSWCSGTAWAAVGTGGAGTVQNTAGNLTANALVLGAGTVETKVAPGITTDGTSRITLGVAGTSVGTLAFTNATSGLLTVQPPTGALGTTLVTLPNANSTLPIFGQQCTFTGPTAARSYALPDAAASLGYLGLPQNSKNANYTTVLDDNGKHIFHPGTDTTARTFTIDSNANVAQPLGATHTFVNQHGGGVITIAITTDTLRMAGPGTTGSRTLAADGIATAIKIATTEWLISGTGLS